MADIAFEKDLKVTETGIGGLRVVDLAVHGDSRGWFKENWQRAKMTSLGIPDLRVVQNNVSYNDSRGVTRGIHAEPWDKFISVARGSVFGAWVDLREGSATYGKVYTTVLDPSKAIYVPRGVGNSFQALEDGTAYTYLVDAHWSLELKRTYTFVNLADPELAIEWPIPLDQATVSDADLSHPMLKDVVPMAPRRTLVTGRDGNLNFMKFAGNGIDTSELLAFCNEMPFFADRRVVLVENSGLFKSSNEDFAKKLVEIEDTSVAIFVEMDVDTRYKLFKAVDKNGEALDFATPDEKMMVTWVKSLFRADGVATTDTAIYKIIEAANMDMNCIKNEVDKMISYAGDTKQVSEHDVDLLCSQDAESKVYQMIDFIIAKQKEKACSMYHDLLENKESAIMINACIMRQFNKLLLVKMALSDGAQDASLAKIAGCPVWAVKNYKAQCRGYSMAQLKDIVENCQDMDYKLKTGQVMDNAAMEVMIVELCEMQ